MSRMIKSLFVLSLFGALLGLGSLPVHAQASQTTDSSATGSPADPLKIAPPVRSYALGLQQIAAGRGTRMLGISNQQTLQFTLPRNQSVTKATLELVFTPSPALLPKVSHLMVFLNEELMEVVPVLVEPPGRQQSHSVALNPDYLSTFNQVRIEFVGHYTEVCEDLANSALWLDLSGKTHVSIEEQALLVANDLAFFPEPFLDNNDMLTQTIPFVFAKAPSPAQLEVAATLSSYFGAIASWRTVEFPVSFNDLPEVHHSVVLAINDQRPEWLKDYPAVDQPTIDIISAPDNPYQKLLLVLGRNDADLKTAVTALTLGGALFRGQSVQVDAVDQLAPRKPYDAPNWIPTDRPVYFSELVDFPGQLEVSGLTPPPIRLNVNVPPDLFVWRSHGIPLDLIYRYTSPARPDESRLTLSLNNRFVSSYPLLPNDEKSAIARMNLQILGNEAVNDSANLIVPAFRVGAQNQIGIDFSFASTIGGAQSGSCQTVLPVDTRAAVDSRSSIDFSGYVHYVEMPNLRIFANSGFPFSRMADLSETVVVLEQEIEPRHASTLLRVVGQIGARTGYPAYRIRVTQDWAQARTIDADILWIGSTPEDFRSRPDANLLLDHTTATLTRPLRPADGKAGLSDVRYLPEEASDNALRVSVRSVAPIAAIVGMQSPYFPERSMVGLLATTPADYQLLNQALNDSGKRDAMQGSVVIIRSSGVASSTVGPRYFIGDLQWWQRLWFHLSERPFLLAGLAAIGVLLTAWLLWIGLGAVARRRLSRDG